MSDKYVSMNLTYHEVSTSLLSLETHFDGLLQKAREDPRPGIEKVAAEGALPIILILELAAQTGVPYKPSTGWLKMLIGTVDGSAEPTDDQGSVSEFDVTLPLDRTELLEEAYGSAIDFLNEQMRHSTDVETLILGFFVDYERMIQSVQKLRKKVTTAMDDVQAEGSEPDREENEG